MAPGESRAAAEGFAWKVRAEIGPGGRTLWGSQALIGREVAPPGGPPNPENPS